MPPSYSQLRDGSPFSNALQDYDEPNNVPRLPEDLIAPIFDFMAFQQLLVASHLCRQWRRIAHGHVTFWRHLKLDPLDVRYGLLATDSDSGLGRPRVLDLQNEGDDTCVKSEWVDTLANCICFLRELKVKVPSRHAGSLWCALSGAATELRILHIELDYGFHCPDVDVGHAAVPQSVLESVSLTKLKRLGLANVALPRFIPTSPLKCVEEFSLEFGMHVACHFPVVVFGLFPALQRLRLRGHSITDGRLRHEIIQRASAIQHVEARMTVDFDLEDLRRLKLLDVPTLLVLNPSDDSLYDILETPSLTTPFQLLLHAEASWLTVSVRCLGNLFVRHFVQPRTNYTTYPSLRVNPLLENDQFLQRQVSSLAISTSAWPIVHPYLSRFDFAITSLILNLDDRRARCQVEMPVIALRLPALKTLVLHSSIEFAVVDIESLLVFRHQTVSQDEGRTRIELYLVNVQLEGKWKSIHEKFEVKKEPPPVPELRWPKLDFEFEG